PIYSAYQELTRFNCCDGAGKISTLAGCYAIDHTSFGMSVALLAFVGVPAIVRLANMASLFGVEKPWLRPSMRLFDWTLLKPIAAQGFCFLILQMAGIISFQTDKLIINTNLGPTAVADYAVVNRIFLTAYGVYMLFLTPIWPAYGEALRRGDLVWIKRNLRLSLWFGCGAMALLGLFLLWQGEAVLRLWIGRQAGINAGVVLGMTFTFAFKAWVDCRSVIFNAAGDVRQPIYFWTAQALLNLTLSVVLVRFAGVLG